MASRTFSKVPSGPDVEDRSVSLHYRRRHVRVTNTADERMNLSPVDTEKRFIATYRYYWPIKVEWEAEDDAPEIRAREVEVKKHHADIAALIQECKDHVLKVLTAEH